MTMESSGVEHVGAPSAHSNVGRGWLWSIGIASVLLGILVAHQIRALREENPAVPASWRANWLAQRLVEAQDELRTLRSEIDNLRAQLMEYERRASEGESLLEAMRRELIKARILAGLTPVKGPGIIVQLNDSAKRVTPEPEAEPSMPIVHDLDLREVVNELKAAGAEAIAINGQRIIATSEIRCSGAFILVNGHRIAAPYMIYAIGDSEELMKALTIPQGVIDRMKVIGLEVKVVPRREIIIPSLPAPPKFKYARPADVGAPESEPMQ